jgi:hypothetical protein
MRGGIMVKKGFNTQRITTLGKIAIVVTIIFTCISQVSAEPLVYHSFSNEAGTWVAGGADGHSEGDLGLIGSWFVWSFYQPQYIRIASPGLNYPGIESRGNTWMADPALAPWQYNNFQGYRIPLQAAGVHYKKEKRGQRPLWLTLQS